MLAEMLSKFVKIELDYGNFSCPPGSSGPNEKSDHSQSRGNKVAQIGGELSKLGVICSFCSGGGMYRSHV